MRLQIQYPGRDNSSRFERELRQEIQAHVQAQNISIDGNPPCLPSLQRAIEAYFVDAARLSRCTTLDRWRTIIVKRVLEVWKSDRKVITVDLKE